MTLRHLSIRDRSLQPRRPDEVAFDGAPVRCYDSVGHPIYRWAEYGMPKLGQYSWILQIVHFLYENPEAARSGINSGGTCFLVTVPSKRWPSERHHIHAVSNWHVTTGGEPPPCPTIGINKLDGTIDVIDLLPDDWIYTPGGSDITVSPPLPLNRFIHKAAAADISTLLNSNDEKEKEVGAADDVFMVGRFVDYEGIEETVPAFRFGHISIADAKIKQKTGYEGRSIVVDMHSRSGFSGSPVFYYRTAGSMFWEKSGNLLVSGHELKIIGIHYGQFPEQWEVKKAALNSYGISPHAQQALITDEAYIEGLSGMTCVAPAQEIIDLLNKPRLAVMREAIEKEWERELMGQPLGPKSEKAVVPRQIETPTEGHSILDVPPGLGS